MNFFGQSSFKIFLIITLSMIDWTIVQAYKIQEHLLGLPEYMQMMTMNVCSRWKSLLMLVQYTHDRSYDEKKKMKGIEE